jgi:selenide,water dikinase
MTTAAKFKKIDFETLLPAAHQMATLNNHAAEAMKAVDFHACTDITGFGLVGHGLNIAKASDLTFRVRSSDVPLFPGVQELAKRGLYSGGVKSGRAALGDKVRIGGGVNEERANLFFDAETSGGLLIVINPDQAPQLEAELRKRNLPVCNVGEFAPYDGKLVDLL